LKARLPAEREAHIGETMNFNSPAYVTDPVTWKIKVPEIPRVEGVEKHTVPTDVANRQKAVDGDCD